MSSRLGFILKGYPRVSETFIAQEIYLLEQMGFEIEIFSMRKAREPERQPIVSMIKAKVTYLPEYILPSWKTVSAENAKAFVRHPLRWLFLATGALVKSALQRDDDPIKRFLQAGWLVGSQKLGTPEAVAHLHSHFAHAPTELAWYAARLSGLRFSISAHAKDIYTISKNELANRIRASELIMTCTAYNHNFLRALPHVPPSKVHRVYHGIDLETFKPSQGSKKLDLRHLVSVGRLVPKKGYEDIFSALKILKDQGENFRYDIYGAGELYGKLTALAESLGLKERIVFHKTATHPTIIARYDEGGLFLCGSRLGEDGDRDGIPNTLAEAMAMELPVVATAVSGIPELVQHEETGLLVDEKKPEQLAAAIQRLWNDPALAEEMGRMARARINEVFNSKIWIHQCASLLRPFTEGPRP